MTTLQEIERFHFDYAACLDDGRYDEWPSFFSPNCTYEVLSRENVEQGLPAPLMSCYSHGMVTDRVAMLVSRTLTYRRMYLKHLISNVRILSDIGAVVEARANFLVLQSTLEGVSSIYLVGEYQDVFELDGGKLRLKTRKAVLDSFGIDTMLAVPV